MDNLQTSEVSVSVEIENYLQQRISLDESLISSSVNCPDIIGL